VRPEPHLNPCVSGLCSLNVDDMWDLFESLTSYQWQCECASESFVYPSLPPYDLRSPYDSSYPLDVCSHCQSCDHDVNSCPYYDVSDKAYELNAMI